MKKLLRKELRAARRALQPAEHRKRSSAAQKAVTRLRPFGSGKRIALYLPFDAETDTAALIAAARRRGARVFVPIVVDRRHSRIRFYPLEGKTRSGTFGIAVPTHMSRPLPARWFDLIVVPLVGVDAEGRRLGMGGGFYDRALNFRRHRRRWMGPHFVGLAFESQRAATGFAEPWDLRLDSLATESGLQHFSRGCP